MNAQEFVQELTKIVQGTHPNSYVNCRFVTNLLPSIFFRFAGTKKEGWVNGIVENDPNHLLLNIDGFDKYGNGGEKLKLEVLINSNRNSRLKGKTGTQEQVLKHVWSYFSKLEVRS